ncbi:MAG: hypothetical protein WCR40_01535 [Candidatus Paceibacterota bacterium]
MKDFLIQKVYAQPSSITGVRKINPTSDTGISFDLLLQNILNEIVSPIIYFLLALAVVYFVWGMMTFIRNADSAEKRKEGYSHMLWGVVGIFIMISAKGLINLILSIMGLN